MKLIWKTEQRDVKDLKMWQENPRTIDESSFKDLKDSVEQDGDWGVLVIDTDGTVISGNQRLKAIDGKVDVKVPNRKLTDKERKRIALRANRTKGKDNFDILANWDKEDLLAGWFDEKDLDKLLNLEPNEKDDVIPDNAPTVAQLGDIWQLGRHRVMCGDSTDKDAVARLMEGKKADMVFTDPPYGIKVVHNQQIGGGGKLGFVGATGEAKARQYREIINDETTETAKKHYELCKELGFQNYIIWGGNYFTDFLSPERGWIVWDKKEGDIKNTFADCELAWTNMGKNAVIYRHLWAGLLRKGDRVTELKERVHPTQKPVEVLSKILIDYTGKEMSVCDCFLGSGSTLIACEKTNRICYGMEIDPKYTDVIIKRWEEYTGNKAKKVL